MNYDETKRLQKVTSTSTEDPMGLIFMWVKKGVIKKKEFKFLCEAYYDNVIRGKIVMEEYERRLDMPS